MSNNDRFTKILNRGLQKLKARHAESELDLSLAHAQIEVMQQEINELNSKYQTLQKQHDELLESLKEDKEEIEG